MNEKLRFAPIVNLWTACVRAVQSQLPAHATALFSAPWVASMKGEKSMTKTIFVLTGAALALTSAPGAAQPTVAKGVTCTKYVNGNCVQTHKVKYKVGYVFGPSYTYTPISDIPQTVVTQYSLGDKYRYV